MTAGARRPARSAAGAALLPLEKVLQAYIGACPIEKARRK